MSYRVSEKHPNNAARRRVKLTRFRGHRTVCVQGVHDGEDKIALRSLNSVARWCRCRDAGVRPSMGSVGDAYDNAMCESFFATLECELLGRCCFKTQTEAHRAAFEFIEGFYNRRQRHSSIGYLSPVDYERRHPATAVDPDAHQPAAVLAAVKDKPFGRPQEGAVLDRRCARQPHHRAGRDGRMAPPGAEPKNATKPEDNMT